MCLLVTDLKRGPDPWFVLTGDTLFVGAVGRPDLPGNARENAALLHGSLHRKLLTLADDVEIFPGHFSGSLCGVGLSGKPTSTIAFERRWNPMLTLDRQAFIDAMSNVPAKPDEMDAISQGFTWSTTVIMKIDLVGPARRGLAMGLNECAGMWPSRAPRSLAPDCVPSRFIRLSRSSSWG